MVTQKITALCCILCFATSMLLAQTVEKLSASFTFPSTLTSLSGKSINPNAVSFFRATRSAQKGKIALQWNVGSSAVSGTISIYSVSGILVKRAVVTANRGTWQCDLVKAASGIYLVSISYGQYKQNLKLALYR
jgi:Ca2+/H+ antiporter